MKKVRVDDFQSAATMTVIALVFAILGWAVMDFLLIYTIPKEVTQEDWIDAYMWGLGMLILFILGCSLAWYFFGRWVTVRSAAESNKRFAWIIFLFVAIAASAIDAFYVSAYTQEGKAWVYSIIGFLGIGCFYLATLWGTSASLKYNVPGAIYFRR